MSLIGWAERGWMPDGLVRIGIRRLLKRRLQREDCFDPQSRREALRELIAQLRAGPLALATDLANQQHYEVPTAFFQRVLGEHKKYSCCYYDRPTTPLAEAEAAMLKLACERAEIADGMEVLELGCGWGSMCLWIAAHYPRCQILAVSNSNTQRQYIQDQCRERGLTNLEVQTADMREFATLRTFDRVVSIEMFEHMRNYQLLHQRIAGWLRPEGKLMVHIFCHRQLAYEFETEGEDNWMGRHFFTGGLMPSDDLLLHFQDDLAIEDHWTFNGNHYARTCEDWLKNLDGHRDELLSVFAASGCPETPAIQLQRWRMFFMACAELFRYGSGDQWFVSHYRFRLRDANIRSQQ
ncbi:MAG: class I SAM-dependent methyltransferase [Planctomycetaceae bacterium]|nr:MAG: class I SAM-dependent methyltransferase [Planctomycetaceae bacterium]